MGLPKFLTYLFLHATACGLRRIAINLAITVDLVLPSGPLRPSASATIPISKLYQHFRGRGSPYGLQDSLSTLHLCLVRRNLLDSATGARLDTGGWLTLT